MSFQLMQNQGSDQFQTVASTDHCVQLTLFTEPSSVAGQADAGEGVDSIQTGGSIQAWIGLALVDICRGDGVRGGQEDTR